MIEHLFQAVGLVTLVGACGASMAFGFAAVCRWMAWAPINININVNVNQPQDEQ